MYGVQWMKDDEGISLSLFLPSCSLGMSWDVLARSQPSGNWLWTDAGASEQAWSARYQFQMCQSLLIHQVCSNSVHALLMLFYSFCWLFAVAKLRASQYDSIMHFISFHFVPSHLWSFSCFSFFSHPLCLSNSFFTVSSCFQAKSAIKLSLFVSRRRTFDATRLVELAMPKQALHQRVLCCDTIESNAVYFFVSCSYLCMYTGMNWNVAKLFWFTFADFCWWN